MREKLTKEDVGFAQIKNEVLNNSNLSFKAKGLFAYLYSKPDDWEFSVERIKNDSTDGFDGTNEGIKELEEIGYLIRKKRADGRKDWYINYNQSGEKPTRENPKLGKSQLGKIGSISNTDSIQTNNSIQTKKKYSPFLDDSKLSFTLAESLDNTKVVKKTLSEYRDARRIESGRAPMQKRELTPKQKSALKRMFSLSYFQKIGLEHEFEYLLEEDEQANAKFCGLARSLEKRYGDGSKAVIDWWFESNDNAWCDYHPSNFFSIGTYMKYDNYLKNKKGGEDKNYE